MKNSVLRSAGIVLMLLSAGFLLYRITKIDFSSIEIELSFSSLFLLFTALVIQTISVFVLGILFARNVGDGKDGRKVPLREAVLVYSRANLGKYIPGNVFQYVERNLFFSSYGVNQADTVLASLLEVMCLIVGAFVLSLIFGNFEVIREAVRQYGYVIPILCGLAVIVIIIGIIFIRKKKKSLKSVVKRLKSRGGIKLLAVDVVSYTLVLLLMGAVTLIAICAMASPESNTPELSGLFGAYIAAWLCGFVIIGAPGGIGVREAVFSLIYINTPYLDTVLTLSLLVRVISVVADVLAFIVMKVICSTKKTSAF